jgi:DNA modification methylase
MNLSARVLVGDNRETLKSLPDCSVQSVVTSPPYFGLRDYGHDEQIGLENTPQAFVEELCKVFDEVWRVLKDDGTVWVNLGDSYAAFRDSKATPDTLRNGEGTAVGQAANRNPANLKAAGLKHKDLIGIPWRFALAMQDRGWYLRSDIIWHKPNPMPESVTDRPTKSHEYIFLLTKSSKYYYDSEAIKEDAIWAEEKRAGLGRLNYRGKRQGEEGTGQEAFVSIVDKRNKRSVWTVNVKPYKEAHFATYPPELITPCILAGSKEGDIVLDPFSGSGTTGEVALQHNRNYIGLELNPDYAKLSEKRLSAAVGMFGDVVIV